MSVKPDTLNLKVWAKLDDIQKEYVAQHWPTMTEQDRIDVNTEVSNSVAAAIELLVIDMPEDFSYSGEPPVTVAEPTDVKSYIDSIYKAVDDEAQELMADVISHDMERNRKKIALLVKLVDLKLDLPIYDSSPNVESNSMAAKLGDAYWVPAPTKNDPSKMTKRHRLHDLFDQVFGVKLLSEVDRLDNLSDDAQKTIGEAEYRKDKMAARKMLSVGRSRFAEVASAVSAFEAINTLPGVKLSIMNDADGGYSRSPTPIQLANTETFTSCAISVSDLEAYRADVAKELVANGKYKTMYEAVIKSKPVKKRKAKTPEQNAGGSNVQGNDTKVANINQWESAAADEAALTETAGFVGEWLKRANDPDKANADSFLLSEYKKVKFYDRVFGMNGGALMKRAGELLDAEATAAQPQTKVA